jgi:hypothetical protein
LEDEIQKNQSRKSWKVKIIYNDKKRLDLTGKKQKNDEISKKKTIAKTI